MVAPTPRSTPGAQVAAWVLARASWPAAAFVLLATAIAGTHDVPFGIDVALHAWSAGHRWPPMVSIARLITASAGGVPPYVAALLGGWVACDPAVAPRRRALTAAVALLVLAAGERVRGLLMVALARPRPPFEDWAASASGFAFPSGHSTTSALAAGLLVWATRRAVSPRLARVCAVCGAGWASSVGASRVYLGVHWPTDVLGGWLLAATWLALAVPVIAVLADHRPRKS